MVGDLLGVCGALGSIFTTEKKKIAKKKKGGRTMRNLRSSSNCTPGFGSAGISETLSQKTDKQGPEQRVIA